MTLQTGRVWFRCSAGSVLAMLAVWAAFRGLGPSPPLDAIEDALQHRNFQLAENLARRSLRSHVDDSEASLLLARSLLAQNKLQPAAALLEQIPGDDGYRAEGWFRAGTVWWELDHHGRAEFAWRECLELPRDSLGVPEFQHDSRRQLCGLYALQRRRGDLWTTTAAMYENAVPRERYIPLVMRLRYYFEMVAPSVAIEALEKAHRNDPADAHIARAIAVYCREDHRIETAMAIIEPSLQRTPMDADCWDLWMQCLHEKGDFARLKEATKAWSNVADPSVEVLKSLAVIAAEDHDWPAAVRHLTAAMRLEPSRVDLHHRLGQVLMRMNRTDHAAERLAESRRLQKCWQSLRDQYEVFLADWMQKPEKRLGIAIRFAEVFEELRSTDEAIGWWRVALAENPADKQGILAMQRLGAGSTLQSGEQRGTQPPRNNRTDKQNDDASLPALD